jgi:hypothetical protein
MITSTDARKNKTQNEDKQNKEHNTENLKDYQYSIEFTGIGIGLFHFLNVSISLILYRRRPISLKIENSLNSQNFFVLKLK